MVENIETITTNLSTETSSDDVIRIRKGQILALMKRDRLMASFVISVILSFLFGILPSLGISIPYISLFTTTHWFILAGVCLLSTALVYMKKRQLSIYPLLGFITWLAVWIRTRNLPGLKDITTNDWTLGPDLDPFLFLRWAKHIVEEGSLFAIDTMRYVPLGFETRNELILTPYLIAWFHKIAIYFGSSSVTHSAILYPVAMFGLTVIAFFFMVREIFMPDLGKKKAGAIGLIASLFLSILPVLLPRTIAGIPEKESSAFLFLSLAFYFFLRSWRSEKNARYLFALLSGITTAMLALVWGGYIYVFFTLVPALFLSFLFGTLTKKRLYTCAVWYFSAILLMAPFTTRYQLFTLLIGITTGSVLLILLITAFHTFIVTPHLQKYFITERFKKIPLPLISTLLVTLGVAIVSVIVSGPEFITSKIQYIIYNLVTPTSSRLIQTVAENKPVYFVEWVGSFGPVVENLKNIPLLFWLTVIGSVYLFLNALHAFTRKERIILTTSYIIFLIAIIFSRYKPDSILNGTSYESIALFLIGFIAFLGSIGYFYYRNYHEGKHEQFATINIGILILLTFFFMTIFSVRNAVRLIMMLVPPVSIMVAYFVVAFSTTMKNAKDEFWKIVRFVLVMVVILSALFAAQLYYNEISTTSKYHVPSPYTHQWQKAMAWVRESTPQQSVFGHWWDYGYWLQSIGNRATVLDGGNFYSYWNHLMGRHGLSGSSEQDALEYLYAHNTTHFLIDSTDIGKYSAYSLIGSDSTYDRASYIPSFRINERMTQETKNSTIYFYEGGATLDEDIRYNLDDTQIFLPAGQAGLGGILIERDKQGNIATQPRGIFVYQGKQFTLPLRYAFDDAFQDFGSGVEAGFYLMHWIIPEGAEGRAIPDGALLYLSPRTVKSRVAWLYLYKQQSSAFKLIHSEDDAIVAHLKSQNVDLGGKDIIYINELRGPIRIWEIRYPKDILFKPEYANTFYPEELQRGR